MIVNSVVIAIIALFAFLGMRSVAKRLHGDCGCSGGGGAAEIKLEPMDKDKSHYLYTANVGVEGMKCKDCAIKVSNVLNSVDGIWTTKVNIGKKSAALLLKNSVTDEQIRSAVANAGYAVTGIRKRTI
jgi:copper chaperone CopZ